MTSPVKRRERFTRYFSFGEDHKISFAHKRGFINLDSSMLVKITAPDPREEMTKLFGDKWDGEYEELPNMKDFKGGVFDINKGRRVAM